MLVESKLRESLAGVLAFARLAPTRSQEVVLIEANPGLRPKNAADNESAAWPQAVASMRVQSSAL